MTHFLDYFTQGSRIFFTSWKNRLFPKRYHGNAQEICQQVVDACWNGRFFQTSVHNFPQFWSRDLGWCISSLIKLGYEKKVHQTIRYALNRFKGHKKITTTITPGGKPFDFPTMAVDSLPWFIHSIHVSKFSYYEQRHFLNRQIKLYFTKVVDPETGLVRSEEHFSSMKDFAIRDRSCYDNCMLALLAKNLEKLKYLDNPFKKYHYPTLLRQNFWNGEYFYDDLTKKEYVAGDANLFPLFFDLVHDHDNKMLKSVIKKIQEEELDSPLPLKYTKSRTGVRFIPDELFLRNYESNSVWTHMGPLYIQLVSKIDQQLAKRYKKRYTRLIEKEQGFLEVLDVKGRPFRTPFYYCDRGMLWAANYLTL